MDQDDGLRQEPKSPKLTGSPSSLRKASLGQPASPVEFERSRPVTMRTNALSTDLVDCIKHTRSTAGSISPNSNSAGQTWSVSPNGRVTLRPSSALSLGHMSPEQRRKEKIEFHQRQSGHEAIARRRSHAEFQRAQIQHKRDTKERLFDGAKGAEGLNVFLKRKFGTVLAGWRFMDQHGRGYISRSEFCLICRDIGFHGQLQSIWQELDFRQEGFITLLELNPEIGHYVGSLKQALQAHCGGVLEGWQKFLDPTCKGFVTDAEFIACCKQLKQTHEEFNVDHQKLFSMLVKGGCSKLTLAEFDPRSWEKICFGDIRIEKPNDPETWRRLSSKPSRYCPYRPSPVPPPKARRRATSLPR
mmetsp:Transcript_96493/g.171559  ORF Transcript_96493/g.171559 Transcript_96493/m.171559 type:complete len:358 (-) Transcript_96493:46-1119(-)